MATDFAGFQRNLVAAQAASAAGDWPEAARLWAQVVAANPVNGSYWAGLAAARFEAGAFLAAADAYHRVLDLGVRPAERDHETFPGGMPYLIPGEVAYSIACCYLRLGETGKAMDTSKANSAAGRCLNRSGRELAAADVAAHAAPVALLLHGEPPRLWCVGAERRNCVSRGAAS